jgi:RNA polymerase-binding transcription factor DksA
MAAKKKSASKAKGVSKKKAAAKKVTTRVNNTAKKSSGARKTTAKPAAAKKPAAKKAASKVTKTPAPNVSKKTTGSKKAPAKAETKIEKVDGEEVVAVKRGRKKRANAHLSAKELRDFKRLLLNLRDSVVDEISFLTGDNLNGKQLERTGEEGTDNFNREFALKLVSSEQDIIYEIDEALGRIANGTYGLCEHSGDPIEKERLKVMPHARHSVRVQSELEKGRTRYRPFGPSLVRP